LYGLGEVDGFTNLYRPILGIRAKLSDSNGNRIWQSLDSVTANNESLQEFKFEQYFNDAQVLKDSFSNAATTIAETLSNNM